MLDDAHDLNKYQREHLNSWIAYRDNSLFSFKIFAYFRIASPSSGYAITLMKYKPFDFIRAKYFFMRSFAGVPINLRTRLMCSCYKVQYRRPLDL